MASLHFPSKALWAKKSDSASVYKWLPLEQHLLDTRNVINALWQHWLSAGSKRQIISALSENNEDAALKLISFLSLTHDLGKATPAFQAKRKGKVWSDLDRRLLENLALDGFSDLEDLQLTSPSKSPHALASQVILQKFGVKEDVACIVGAHHGKPVDAPNFFKEQTLSYTANYYQSDLSGEECVKHWFNTQKAIYEWALSEAGYKHTDELPSVSLTGQVLLCGLLIMADWIASNELYFPLINLGANEISDQYSRMYEGWTHWFHEKADVFTYKPDIHKLYKDSFKFLPRPVQEEFAQLISTIGDPGIIILEAPMGIGKTEMALAAAEQLGSKLGQYGIYFGLPTQATSDGIFERIEDWVGRLGNEGLPGHKSIQLVHGKSALNEEYQRLKRKTSNSDAEENGSVSADEWFVGRKTATLDDFVVGTVDHFLMTALKQKHLALRHLGFSNKVVIIDEVHAYDAYMSQYLQMALEWMGAYHVPVIMLSATLPGQQREAFVRSYLRGQGYKSREMKCPDDLNTISAYPLVTYTDGAEIKQAQDFSPQEDKEFLIIRLSEEDLVAKVAELLEDGGVLGLMVNTVKRAQAMADLFSEVFGPDTVELLHSQFIATNRIAKEKKLLDMIGKGKVRPSKKIIIGTQVIEQSLDIDFDVLISDLAPMDLLLQRMGRLHRHKLDNRPAKLTNPQVYVLGTDPAYNFEPGSEFVYGQYLLMRTQYYLPDRVFLPTDISPLVQKVYGDAELALDEASAETYQKAKSQHEYKIQQKEHAAKTYRINKPHSRLQKSLVGWLQNVNLYAEECGHAQVRDADETVEVILVQACGTGYSFVGEKADISGELNDPAIAQKLARQTITLPRAVTYNIDKAIKELEEYNRKYLAAWQRQPWLKGCLGIILNDQGNFPLGQFCLKYSSSQGLSYQKLNA